MKTEPPGHAPATDRRAKPPHTVHGPSDRSARRKMIDLVASVAVALVGVYLILD
jgi:hypothetical protein